MSVVLQLKTNDIQEGDIIEAFVMEEIVQIMIVYAEIEFTVDHHH